jgi:outer membrane protein OmpA-like peptidoglycan-associated protein/tetratricopeptide (TPR) repeat protein
MRNKILLLLVSIALLCGQSVLAQKNVDFEKKNFTSRKPAFKEAMKNIKHGDEYYNRGDGYFSVALEYYLKANIFNADNGFLNYKIGVCYLKSSEQQKALRYFVKAEKLLYNVAPDIHFRLGEAYQVIYKFDEAVEEYNKFKNGLSPEELNTQKNLITKRLEECGQAKGMIADSVRVFIDNAGEEINTKYNEYSPVITTDESVMYFTSKREGSVGGNVNKFNEFDEDVFSAVKDGDKWKKAENLKQFNTKMNDGVLGISPDGQQLYVYQPYNGGDVFVSKRKGDKWMQAKDFKKVNTPDHECAITFSPDNNTVYFCSNTQKFKDHFGGYDIYSCKKNKKGKWENPVNLGSVVNSSYDEVDVFMHPDGRTLYFCSNGHKNIGGFDVFKTTLKDDGTWTEPENLGYPINTPLNERFFVMSGSGKHGYYSSAKLGGMGGYDIYKITFLGPEKQSLLSNEDFLLAGFAKPIKEKVEIEQSVDIKTSRLTVVKGTITDGTVATFSPLEADIEISDNATGQLISTNKSNAASGKFLLTLPSGKNYAITVKKQDFLFHSENFNLPATSTYQEVNVDIKLMKIQKEAKIVLRNVFFEFGKSSLQPESFAELDELIEIMKSNPKLKIEIGGHTDNKSSRAFNLTLSEKRAHSVVDYMAKKIDPSRLSFKGYAFDFPVASNDTEEGRAQNRRVEFKIISTE